ncbi:MAG TPA: PEP-CTERM sorting domain-containing protein, partial [Thermoflexia bacterium]|nr:PEP-CTERM sorting domain-containing protein [Thermoflexia bacterium]
PAHDLLDGYTWLTVLEDGNDASDEGFAPFAARRLILTEMQRNRGQMGRLDTLDHLHEIAIANSIVTPYSSMLVLVNQQQEDLLDELEEGDDRFEREYEQVGETVENALTVTGVPEPEEWLLLALAAAMLVWYVRAGRRQPLKIF